MSLTAEKLEQTRAKLQAALDKIDRATGGALAGKRRTVGGQSIDEFRASRRHKKAEEHKLASVLECPDIEDRERRARLEQSDEEWLSYYFGPGCGLFDPFTYQFTTQQL